MKMGSPFFYTGPIEYKKKTACWRPSALVCILVATLQFDKLHFDRHSLVIFCCKEIYTGFKISYVDGLNL